MQSTQKSARRSQLERTDATRAALIAAARTLFEKQGFAATGTPQIVEAAHVTRGALYHHFADKTALFLAVCDQVALEVAADIEQRTAHTSDATEALMAGAQAYFAAMAEAGRARLLLLEAPSALSGEQWQALNERTGLRELQAGLTAALGDQGLPVRELAVVLSAAFDRAALAMARGEPAAPYQNAIRLLITRFLG